MIRALLRNVSLHTRTFTTFPQIHHKQTLISIPKFNNFPKTHRLFFSSESDSPDQNPTNPDPSPPSPAPAAATTPAESGLEKLQEEDKVADFVVDDVSTPELKNRIENYFKGDEEALPSILEAILARKLSGNHEDTDDEMKEEFSSAPLEDVDDAEFESDFEEISTDEEVDDLYSARDIVVKRMMKDEYFNMDVKKWEKVVKEATEDEEIGGDTRDCVEVLEDMIYWDKLLPEKIKQKVQAKYDELAEKLENKELEVEEAYEQFKVFEDEIVAEHIKDEEERPLESDEVAQPMDKKNDDPPGVGPVLRWHTRVVFAPGGDAWHPKNRKVKLSVTVKELGLTKYQFRRLREIVGKRYHPGKDELTITSERFDHREENRKDCLRTLLAIIEEAGKANALVDEARTSYVKQRLKANPAFMARLHAKTKQAPAATPA